MEQLFYVLKNYEWQYSVWPYKKEVPFGWSKQTKALRKEEAFQYISSNWVNMKPLTLQGSLIEVGEEL